MGVNYVDISGAIADSIAQCRDCPDQASLLPTNRWLGTLTVDGHGGSDGVSWVRLADPHGMRWGYLWPWRDMHVSQNSHFLTMATVDLDDFLVTGTFSAPDGAGVRWLLPSAWVKSRRPDLLPLPAGAGNGHSGHGFSPGAVAGQRVDISGALAAWQEQLRAADPAQARPWERWVAAVPAEARTESDGVSVVRFALSPGPALGWRWEWGKRRSPGEDLLTAVIDDLTNDLAHGGITNPDTECTRWLLPAAESIKPPVPWARH